MSVGSWSWWLCFVWGDGLQKHLGATCEQIAIFSSLFFYTQKQTESKVLWAAPVEATFVTFGKSRSACLTLFPVFVLL